MRKTYSMILTACVLCAASPVNAKAGETPQSNVGASREASTAPAKPARMVCKIIERTGSHVRERVCLSKTDWARVEKHMAESF